MLIKGLHIILIFFPYAIIILIDKKVISKKMLLAVYLILAIIIYSFWSNIENNYLTDAIEVYNFLAILALALFPLMKIYAPKNPSDRSLDINRIVRLMEIFLFYILGPAVALLILIGQMEGTGYALVQSMIILTVVFLLPFVIYLKTKEILYGKY